MAMVYYMIGNLVEIIAVLRSRTGDNNDIPFRLTWLHDTLPETQIHMPVFRYQPKKNINIK